MNKLMARRSGGDPMVAMKRLCGPSLIAGLVGGTVYLVVMIIVMGAAGMGAASPLNLGMASFVYTITPPLTMLPTLLGAMGVKMPPAAMAHLAPALHSGHLSPAMTHQLSAMLMSMHVPAPTLHLMAPLMTGHATNSQVAAVMSQLSPAARSTVMAAMPVSASHVIVGLVLHLAFAAFMGVLFFAIIGAAVWFRVPASRTPGFMMGAGVVGGAIVYVINRWALLPPTNPMMQFVPQLAFFGVHLLFGLIVGTAFALVYRRRSLIEVLPR